MIIPQGSKRNQRFRGPVESIKKNYMKNTMQHTLQKLTDACLSNEQSTDELVNSMTSLLSRNKRRAG